MGRIKKSKSIISNSSNCVNKSLLNSFSTKTTSFVDPNSMNVINIENIDKLFFTPIINRNIHKVANSNAIFTILNSSRKFDNTGGLITDFLINAVSIGENNVKLLCNTEFAQRKLFEVQEKLRISEETIDKLNNIIEKTYPGLNGNYINAELIGNVGRLEVLPLLSKLASLTGIKGLIMCYYYAYYHGGYDINAIVNQNNLAKTAILLESIGLTPDPCTGVSPAFVALQELEQTLRPD